MGNGYTGGQLDFQLYKILCELAGVLEQFPEEELARRVEEMMAYLQNKRFRVAVVGEFRRGKSSLINALLGMSILPVDIEPTTATINRITYGLRPKAFIHYKDGRSEEVAIDALVHYITKLTAEAARTAATVREAEIFYPTELCSSGIDVIDTPGLNDTESMTAVTEELLQDVHAALVAVKATMPYSDTECEWVARLMALPEVQHVIVVATCMDLIPRRERRRVLDFMEQRIREKTLERVRERYGDRAEIVEKAERLLGALKVCPVSALQALEAFDSGDYEALEASNVPALKKELVTTLYAQQQRYGLRKTEELLRRTEQWLAVQAPGEPAGAREEFVTAAVDTAERYFARRPQLVEGTLAAAVAAAEGCCERWLDAAALSESMRTCFIRRLCAVEEMNSGTILAALRGAQEEIRGQILPGLEQGLLAEADREIIGCRDQYLSLRSAWLHTDEYGVVLAEAGFPTEGALESCVEADMAAGPGADAPDFALSLPERLEDFNVMPKLVLPALYPFAAAWGAAWRAALTDYVQRALCAMVRAESPALQEQFVTFAQQRLGVEKEKEAQHRARCRRAAAQLERAGEAMCELLRAAEE